MSITLRSLTSRTARTTSIVLIGLLFALQLVLEARQVARISSLAPGALWAWYATYAFIGALFLGGGSLICLFSFARQQGVAPRLFWFCNLVRVAFGPFLARSLGGP